MRAISIILFGRLLEIRISMHTAQIGLRNIYDNYLDFPYLPIIYTEVPHLVP
jgi:hypothetical protein